MRMGKLAATVLALAVAVPVLAQDRDQAREHVAFGIELAKKGLWQDATNQFERAVKIDPSYAEAWNDLGIGYEQLGKLEEARDAYDRALKLEPTNQFIRNNYDMFREIYDRQNVRASGGGS